MKLHLILDEDGQNSILLQEYYDALEAYGMAGEEHHDPNGTDYYAPFEQRAVFTMLTILGEKGITSD